MSDYKYYDDDYPTKKVFNKESFRNCTMNGDPITDNQFKAIEFLVNRGVSGISALEEVRKIQRIKNIMEML